MYDARHIWRITRNPQTVKIFCISGISHTIARARFTPPPTPRHTHTHTHTMQRHTLSLVRGTKARRLPAASYDVDGSRFNGGCNYIANEPEVETVWALLRPKERLYTLELRRSTAIDVAASPYCVCNNAYDRDARDGELDAFPAARERENDFFGSILS